MPSFAFDYLRGQTGEKIVVDLFQKAGLVIKRNRTKDQLSYYDIEFEFNNRLYTAEIKFDIYAMKSGNIAIEYFNPKAGKLSGLFITKADFWIHIVGGTNTVYIVGSEQLKNFIRQHPPHKIIYNAGDGNANLYLYKKQFLATCILKETKPDNLINLLTELTNVGNIQGQNLTNTNRIEQTERTSFSIT